MKEEPSETKPVKRITNKLEQLPSSKKRSLNTDLLATPLTHRLDDAAPKNDNLALAPDTKPLKVVEEAIGHALTMALDNSPSGETPKIAETVPLASSATNVNKAISPSKEVQGKGKETKENSKEVVQEILKEVAKEVEKENAIKAINPSKEPNSNLETTRIEKEKPKDISSSKPPSVPSVPTKPDPEVVLQAKERKEEKSSWAEQPLEPKAVISSKKVEKNNTSEKVEKNEEKHLNIDLKKSNEGVESKSDKDNIGETKPVTEIEMPLFGSVNKFSYTETEAKTRGAKVKSVVLWLMPIFILLAATIGIIYAVPALREKVAERLPYKVASTLRLTTKQISKVTIQEYPYSINEAEKTATMKGTVKNLSDNKIGPIELEFELTKRGDENSKEIRKVVLTPSELGPKGEGTYEFVFSATDFQASKYSKMASGNGMELSVKQLKIANLPPLDPGQAPDLTSQPNNKPKQPDDKIYEGSVN